MADRLYASTAVCLSIAQCQIPAKCVNCSGEHPANSKQCLAWEKEKKILKIKCEQNISFPEARKQYEQFYDTLSYASAVKPGICNKSTQTGNKSTQIDDSFTKYSKQQEQSSSEKHPRKHLRENKTTMLHLLVQGQHLSQQPWK